MNEQTRRLVRIWAIVLASFLAVAGLIVVALGIFFAMALSSWGSNK